MTLSIFHANFYVEVINLWFACLVGFDDEDDDGGLKSLNDKRVSERSITSCPPVFEWDSSLAQIAQQWADQCALVEYNNNSSTRIPSR